MAFNYDMFYAFETSKHLHTGFDATNFPGSITGNLGQQFETTEKMLQLAIAFAKDLKIETFGLSDLSTRRGRLKVQKQLIRKAVPSLEGLPAQSTPFNYLGSRKERKGPHCGAD